MAPTAQLDRIPRRKRTRMVPRPLGDGLFEVDSTWGTLQPIELARGVRTIGELEVIEHLERACRRSIPALRTSIATGRSRARTGSRTK
jgi:hypothetical protein